MQKLKTNWQFIAIIVPVIFILFTQIRNYGGVEQQVKINTECILKNTDSIEITNEKFSNQIAKLTAAVIRNNTLMEINLMQKGVIKSRNDIENYFDDLK